jgi:hypothetical protein
MHVSPKEKTSDPVYLMQEKVFIPIQYKHTHFIKQIISVLGTIHCAIFFFYNISLKKQNWVISRLDTTARGEKKPYRVRYGGSRL